MAIHNVHRREYATSVERLGAILETLATEQDLVWPRDTWAPMKLSDGLRPASAGGHGPVHYFVETYEPGRLLRFRFTSPAGFDGTHSFSIDEAQAGRVRLTHTIDMKLHGAARLSWPLLFRPMHDALLEEALDRVAQAVEAAPRRPFPYSAWVKFLRRVLAYLHQAKKRSN